MRQAAIIAWCLLFAGSAAAQRPPDPTDGSSIIADGPSSLNSSFQPDFARPRSVPRDSRSLKLLPTTDSDLVSLHAQGASLTEILRMIAQNHGLNLVVGPDVTGEVTLSVENAQLDEVLDAILGVAGHTWHRRGNLLYVTRLSASVPIGARLQGRELRVFAVNYISAADAQGVATGLLSPVGKAFVSESDPLDQTRTREILAVEDIPEALARIESYLAQVDRPPRQVLIETHMLQVVLDDEQRHGINLTKMMRAGGASVSFETLGYANTDAKSGMLITLNGNDVDGLVEMIQSNTLSRTLASPKVLVANRQEANIQIGKRLSYLTTTTTQTSTVQSVQFLDTGVVLRVTPVIGDDGQVLMTIKPKVSGGQTNQETGLPEEESTELSTTVLLPDGGGVVVGGLIKEDNVNSLSQVPWFSKLPYVGRLFQRKQVTTQRTEIIIALVTRVVPTVEMSRHHELEEFHKMIPPYAAADLQSSRRDAAECLVPEYIAPGLFSPPFPAPESPQFESPQFQSPQLTVPPSESPPLAAPLPEDVSPNPDWPAHPPVYTGPRFISPELFSSERGLPQSELIESELEERNWIRSTPKGADESQSGASEAIESSPDESGAGGAISPDTSDQL